MDHNYKSRVFINKNKSLSAHIKCEVIMGNNCYFGGDCDNCTEQELNGKDKKECYKRNFTEIESNVSLHDCSDSVSIDFNIYRSSKTEEYINDRLFKLNTMINQLIEFRDNYLVAIDKLKSNINKHKQMT